MGVMKLCGMGGGIEELHRGLHSAFVVSRESPFGHFCPKELGVWSFFLSNIKMGRRVIGISGSLIWSKTLMELIFNSCGEFWWRSGGHSPHPHVGAPGFFSDLLRSGSDARKWVGCRMQREVTAPIHPWLNFSLVPEFAVEDLPSTKLQRWFLRLQWRTYPWAEHSDNDDDNNDEEYNNIQICL